MITRFFSTSKPIHLVIISVLVFVLFLILRLNNDPLNLEFNELLKTVIIGGLLIFSLSLFGFFVTKNHLTERNSYKLVFFFLFLSIIPATLTSNKIIIANFLILLAIRRIISLRSKINIKKKLFDAAFWIALATLFYFWSFLFFALILAALLLFSIESTKNWIIPFLGLLTVAILLISYSIISNNSYGEPTLIIDAISYDYTPYNNMKFIVAVTIIVSLGIWATFFYLNSLKDKPKNHRAAHFLVVLSCFIAMVIVVVSPDKTGKEFLFLFAPLAIIMANYIQIVKDKWFAEAFVWLLILTPVSLLFL
jgi:hypothetical protein